MGSGCGSGELRLPIFLVRFFLISGEKEGVDFGFW